MDSLTQLSIYSRKAIRYGLYALILIASARFILNTIQSIYLKIFPPPPKEATVGFGKLTELPFPQKDNQTKIEYKIETISGELPVFEKMMPVYYMPPIPQNIKALDNAKIAAQKMGFNPNGKPILESTPSVYLFKNENYPSSLTMNIITGVFSISYDLNQDAQIMQNAPSNYEDAYAFIKTFLQNVEFLPEDIASGNSTHEYYKLQSRQFLPVVSLSEANLVKINFFRGNYGTKDEYQVVTPKMPQSNIWFIVAGQKTKNIISGEYHYYPIDEKKIETYPIKTSQEAFELLKNNDKSVYMLNPGKDTNNVVTIRKVYLAYYDAGQYTEYFQPVVVFEGDSDFMAYVPAIHKDYYGKDK